MYEMSNRDPEDINVVHERSYSKKSNFILLVNRFFNYYLYEICLI